MFTGPWRQLTSQTVSIFFLSPKARLSRSLVFPPLIAMALGAGANSTDDAVG